MIQSLKCKIGFHRGNVVPAHEIDEEIDGRSAYVCSYCDTVIE